MRVELERFIKLSPSAPTLDPPLAMADPNDGTGRLFFMEKGTLINPIPSQPPLALRARVRIYENGQFTTFLDLSSEVHPQSESGMLGMTFHPGFANPLSPGYRKFYTFHSAFADPNKPVDFDTDIGEIHHHNVLTEWLVDANNPNQVDLSGRREIFREAHPSDIHNSGTITFGPDGYLYGTIGTPPLGTSQLLTAQDKSTIMGSMYRIDPLDPSLTPGSSNVVSANGKYRIPVDNPFVNEVGALDEIYAYGMRNSYRFSIDPVTGLILAGEVGDFTREEVNVVPMGGNMGWPYREGTEPGPVTAPNPPPTFVSPIAEYSHLDGAAVVGGYIYRGSIPALQGKYIFGDFSSNFFTGRGRLLFADVLDENGELRNSSEIHIKEILETPESCANTFWPSANCALDTTVMSFATDAAGEIYIIGWYPTLTMIHKITDAYLLPEGDYNEDGSVDAADFTVWKDSLGGSVQFGRGADGNGNGIIDAGDYDIWKAHFGESIDIGSGSVAQHQVPGPHSVLLSFQVLLSMIASSRCLFSRHFVC